MIGKNTKYSLPLLVSLPNTAASLDFMAEDLDLDQNQQKLASELFGKGLPPLVTPQCLPYLFGVSHKLIGLMAVRAHSFYNTYEIEKAGGGTRKIEAPRRFLKIIQKWIYEHAICKQHFADFVAGFVKGKNIFYNGSMHAGNGNLMVIDIKDFFPSVGFDTVRSIFGDFGFPERVAYQLAALCCLDGRLPQGAPTSPGLANISCIELDEELCSLASSWGVKYSRYADDLAFSGPIKFDETHIKQVIGMLRKYGFESNREKTRIIGRGGRQVVAGLVVNEKPLPPRIQRRGWRAKFYQAQNRPQDFSDEVPTLFGIAAFVNQYSPDLATQYRAVAQRVASMQRHQ